MEKIHSYIPEREAEPWGFFSLFRRSTDELTYSNIFAYLLDPNRPHGLGDLFLRDFYELLQKRVTTIKTDYSSATLLVFQGQGYSINRCCLNHKLTSMERSYHPMDDTYVSHPPVTIFVEWSLEGAIEEKYKDI